MPYSLEATPLFDCSSHCCSQEVAARSKAQKGTEGFGTPTDFADKFHIAERLRRPFRSNPSI
jgi:hypothetical protein